MKYLLGKHILFALRTFIEPHILLFLHTKGLFNKLTPVLPVFKTPVLKKVLRVILIKLIKKMLIAYEGDIVTFSQHNQPLRIATQLRINEERKLHRHHFARAWTCNNNF